MGNAAPRPGKGRPPGRRGGAGSGPRGPVKTGGTGRGTSHKSSSVEGSPIINVVWAICFGLVGVVAFVGYGLLHGYGFV